MKSEGQAKEELKLLKKKFSDATHICYAFRLGSGQKESVKTFDAREPNLTAGKPILNAILAEDLTDILVAVVRWFGGTKLGKAKLAKTYRRAAEQALQKAERVERLIQEKLSFQIENVNFNLADSILRKYKAELVSKSFDTACQIEALVSEIVLPELKQRLLEALSGKIKFI